MKNSKLTRIKETLKNVLSQFEAERITSDKGILDIQKAGDEIAVGDSVLMVDEEGVESQVEDGDYILTDGIILRIAEGRIAEIIEPEKEVVEETVEEEVKPEETFEEEPEAEPEVENPTNEGEETETEAVVELRKEVNELYEIVRRLEAEIEKLKGEPAAEPATEEFAKVNKIGKTGNEKLDRLARILNA